MGPIMEPPVMAEMVAGSYCYSLKNLLLLLLELLPVTEEQEEILTLLKGMTTPMAVASHFLLIFAVFFVFLSILFRMDITRLGFWKLSLKDSSIFMLIALTNLLSLLDIPEIEQRLRLLLLAHRRHSYLFDHDRTRPFAPLTLPGWKSI